MSKTVAVVFLVVIGILASGCGLGSGGIFGEVVSLLDCISRTLIKDSG
jgi:hypothetical protein